MAPYLLNTLLVGRHPQMPSNNIIHITNFELWRYICKWSQITEIVHSREFKSYFYSKESYLNILNFTHIISFFPHVTKWKVFLVIRKSPDLCCESHLFQLSQESPPLDYIHCLLYNFKLSFFARPFLLSFKNTIVSPILKNKQKI